MLGCAYCIITSSIIPSMYSKDHTDSLLRNVLEKTWIGHLYSVNKTFFVCHPVVLVGYNLSSTSTSAQFMVLSSHLYSRESQWNIFSWQCLPEKMMIMMMRFQKATWLSKGLQTISWTTGGKQRPSYYMYAKVNNAEKISKIDPFNFCSFQTTKSKPKHLLDSPKIVVWVGSLQQVWKGIKGINETFCHSKKTERTL